MKGFILAALATLFIAAAANAGPLTPSLHENVPAFSVQRLSLGVGLDFAQFQTVGDTPFPTWSPKAAWQPGVFGAYVISTRFSLTGSASMNTENHWIEYRVGVRARLWQGAQ